MTRLFGIAGVQMSVVPWDADATIDKMERIINRIGRSFPWVQMILFHELCVSGLVQFDAIPSVEAWNQVRQPIPGALTDRLCEIARREKKWLCPGSMYERENGLTYNTSIVVSPEGEIAAKYRKMFPWYPFEAESTPGDEFCVFEIAGVGKFGISICYDMWFPEMIRTLAWMGAEVILHPTMTPTVDRDLELVLSQASAISNQCYFIDINGVGPWGGGRSMIVDPDGRILQQTGSQETILTEMLDLDRVALTREYGNLGLTQTLKHLRDSHIQFPQYQQPFGNGEVFKTLGKLELAADWSKTTRTP
ncbi:MAG: carbon-nitrogen hydrolase family protein [Chloroflexota bacterium]